MNSLNWGIFIVAEDNMKNDKLDLDEFVREDKIYET